MSQDRLGLGTRQNDRNVAVALGTNHAVEPAEFPPQHMPVKEKQRVKRLVLRGGGYAMSHREL